MKKHLSGRKTKAIAFICAAALLLTSAAFLIVPVLAAPSDLTETFTNPFPPLTPVQPYGYIGYMDLAAPRQITSAGAYAWMSSNPASVTVSYSAANPAVCVATPVAGGVATVSNVTPTGGFSMISFVVTDNTKISYYKIPMGTAGLSFNGAGEQKSIDINVKLGTTGGEIPYNTSSNLISWYSDDPSIAVVNPISGVVTSIDTEGMVIIRGDFTDPWGFKHTISLPVKIGTGMSPSENISGITVSPNPATVNLATSNTLAFTANVTGTEPFPKGVTWEVFGGVAGTSISSSGVLTVAADEAAGTLTVRASSENAVRFVNVPVTVVKIPITGVTLFKDGVQVSGPIEQSLGTPATAKTLNFSATVAPSNASQDVTWEVLGSDNGSGTAVSNISSSGVLTIAANEKSAYLTVRVNSVADPSKYTLARINIPENIGTPIVAPTSVIINGASSVYKGESSLYAAVVLPPSALQEVAWSLVGTYNAGTSIDANGLLSIHPDETMTTIVVQAETTDPNFATRTATKAVVVKNLPIEKTIEDIIIETPVGQTFWMDNIQWYVLMRDGKDTLVWTKDVVGARPFQPGPATTQYPKWSNSDMRHFLNGTGSYAGYGFFFTYLSAKTQSLVKEVTLTTRTERYQYFSGTIRDNSQLSPGRYETTQDKIFLLSIEEMCFEGVNNTPSYDEGRFTLSYATTDVGAIRTNGNTVLFKKNTYRRCDISPEPLWGTWGSTSSYLYWTRSPGTLTSGVELFGFDGHTGGTSGPYAYLNYYGVRPAMWLTVG